MHTRLAMGDPRTVPIRRLSRLDRLLCIAARAMADAAATPVASRPNPADGLDDAQAREPGTTAEAGGLGTGAAADALASRRHAGGLMRVNHVGEVCAQALYEGHALTVGDPALSDFFLAAADEERDHLAWNA